MEGEIQVSKRRREGKRIDPQMTQIKIGFKSFRFFICVHLCHLVRQESFADLVSCKELAMGIARSP